MTNGGGGRGEDQSVKAIRVQLQNGKDLFLKRHTNNNNQQQRKQQEREEKKESSYLLKEGEEEWCAKMNTILNLLPTPECRQKRGGGISGFSALKNSSSGKGGIGKIVLGNANVDTTLAMLTMTITMTITSIPIEVRTHHLSRPVAT
jgi:hypothetical protein